MRVSKRKFILLFAFAAIFVLAFLFGEVIHPRQAARAANAGLRIQPVVHQSSNVIALGSRAVVSQQNPMEHGWALLQQLTPTLTDPKPFPRWMDPTLGWYRRCGTDLLNTTCPVSDLQNQQLSPAFPGKSPQIENGAEHSGIRLSVVFYNATAASWIKSNQLTSGTALQGRLATPNASIPAFPPNSVIVKAIWEVFTPYSADKVKAHPQWNRIPIYDQSTVQPNTRSNTLGKPQSWANQATIDLTANQCEDRDYEVSKGESIPLQCFFHAHYDQCSDALEFPDNKVANGDVAAALPCEFVLVGFHVITKESVLTKDEPTWTWTTFWWTNKAFSVNAAQGRPTASLRPEYRHFVLDATFGADQGSAGTRPPAIFNPYLEGAGPGGITSNCLYCHSRAAFIPKVCPLGKNCMTANFNGDGVAIGNRILEGSPVTWPPPKKDAASTTDQKTLATDSLWSIADSQNAPPPGP